MVSTYTQNIGFEQPAQGDYPSSWANVANTQYSLMDQALAAITSVDVTGGSNVTLTSFDGTTDQARSAILVLTGTPTNQLKVIVPSDKSKLYVVRSKHAGSSFVVIESDMAGTGCTCAPSEVISVMVQGQNTYKPNRIPKKSVSFFYGTTGQIPAGWRTMDGTNGTPNLITGGLFIKSGTSVGNNAATTPTFSLVSAGSHTHTGSTGSTTLTTNQMPNHSHRSEFPVFSNTAQSGTGALAYTGATVSVNTGLTGDSGSHLHSISSDGLHTHTFSQSGSYSPASYTLIPIMKVT